MFLFKTLKLNLISLIIVLISTSIKAQSNPNITGYDFEKVQNKPVKISKINKGHYLIDFGKAYFGTVLIKLKKNQKDTLIVHFGEKLSSNNQIDKTPPGTIRYQKVKVSRLIANKIKSISLTPNKLNSTPPAIILPDSFGVVMPFRYCELENLQIPIEDVEIWQKAFYYKFNDNSSAFKSSDTILNAIWNLCKHTIKATSFAGYYIDGDRERIPYEADAFINQLSHYSVDNVYSLARKTNEYFIENPTWPTEWILHTVFLFYYDYLYTGNTQSIKRYYSQLKDKLLMDLAREDGLISTESEKLDSNLMKKLGFKNPSPLISDIVDWPMNERDGYDMVAINTVVNSFYYQNLKVMSKIAGAIGNTKDSLFYQKKSILIKNTINNKLFDKSRGLYIDGEGSSHASLHANMFPLAFDLVPEEHLETVINFIKSKGMACSVYGAQYLLEGLFKNNEAAYGMQLITDTIGDRNWWNMIKEGSSMTLEAWGMKYKQNLDWNHAWGAAPANIISRYIFGITPEKPGFTEVRIEPQLEGMTFCTIKVPTIRGGIYAEYKLKNKKQHIYKIDLPKKTYKKIIVNKQNVSISQGYLKLNEGLNIIDIKQ